MPVDPSFIGLVMKAVDKAVDSSFGDKALDQLVNKPHAEKNRKKKRSSDKRPAAPRRRSERQARNKRIVRDDLRRVDEIPPEHQESQPDADLNGPGNISGHTYATSRSSSKTEKYQPEEGRV